MSGILYTVIIFPIVQILETVFTLSQQTFKNTGVSIIVISGVVSVLCLPIYIVAEKWQRLERDKTRRMKPKIDKIKAVFRGDEQFMVINTYYRQEHYHPLFALRGTFGVLFQVPFFIAAYGWLSHLEALKGVSFLFIRDLSLPDGLISLAGINRGVEGINLLPVLMTLINCIAGAVYTKGFPAKEKIQLYGIAALFLVLLYNSPAGLVLYWTCNNLFSLGKNIFQKIKIPKKLIYIIYVILAIAVIVLDINLLFIQRSGRLRRLLAVILLFMVFIVPFIPGFVKKFLKTENGLHFRSYLFSCIMLFLLLGIFIPSSVIASSVGEFSFIDSFTTPFPLLWTTMIQAFGIFIFWTLILYAIFPATARRTMTFVMLFFTAVALVNTFLIQENYGFLTNMLVFSEVRQFGSDKQLALLSFILPLLVCGIVFLIWKRGQFRLLEGAQCVFLCALFVLCAVNITRISRGYAEFVAKKDTGDISTEKIYTFSQNGTNVLLIMLDAISAGYIPYIFEEKPQLLEIFKDFTFYPNTVSYANHTLVGALPIYGGYEYTPFAINERREETLLEKQKEAYLLLPTLFANNGYSVTLTDPPFDNHQLSNLRIFEDNPQISAQNIVGKWTHRWQQNHNGVNVVKISDILYTRFIRFCFFKISPLIMRTTIYNSGDWLVLPNSTNNTITPIILDDYAFLDMLKSFTTVKEDGDTYTAIYSHLTHEQAFLQQPEYTVESHITDRGGGFLNDDAQYHVIMAAFIKLYNYFCYLKDSGVYANTRIILVSDHGRRGRADYPGNIELPGGGRLSSYNPLLMVKDFTSNSQEGYPALNQSFDFMTNADAPLFAIAGLIHNPHNPWTGKKLEAVEKEKGIRLVTIGALGTHNHTKYMYSIRPYQWLYVHDNIFNPDNWERVEK